MNNEEFRLIQSIDIEQDNNGPPNLSALDETLRAVVTISTKHFGMNAAYVSQVFHDKELLEIVAFHSDSPDLVINAGTTYQLKSTYCNSVAEATHPVVIENTHTDPTFQHTAAHDLFANIGSYVGVPIVLSNEVVYGTLCVIDTQPQKITTNQTELLLIMGRLLATQIVHDKVTYARAQAERDLRKSEERYREFIERSPDMIVIIEDNVMRYINLAGARMLDFDTPHDVVGQSIHEFIDIDELHRVESIIAPNAIYPVTIHAIEVYLKSRTGRQLIVEVTGFPSDLLGANGFKLVARDITHRKQIETELAHTHHAQQIANQDLLRLNAAKSHFVSIVSHEFRTALTGIQGFSEMMHTEDFTIEEMRDFAKDINEDAKRLNRMITEMLDLDRMESGTMALHRQRTDINQLINNVVTHEARINQHSHQFNVQLNEDVPHAYVDEDKLIQVVKNLISNAIKYSPDGGIITITSNTHNGTILLSFADQGIGMTQDAIASIFERYQRVNSGATRHINGTGLGLPITRQIVEMHNGRIWVESIPEYGSTFYVELPIVTAEGIEV
ncbi:MAG: ATP-binding protein [Chloroflexota bacterium]|jgi:PAS domain S-box-containing protein